MTAVRIHRRADRKTAAAPVSTVDQDEQRRRRRARLAIVYTGSFDLTEEVEQIIGPLAARVAADPVPRLYEFEVDAVVGAVHAVVLEAVKMLAEVDAARRTAHIGDFESRSRAMRLLDQARPRPARPEIDADGLSTVRWADSLVAHARPVMTALGELLGSARPPGGLRGRPSASERLEGALRGIDGAALALACRLDRVAADRSMFAASQAAQAPATDGVEAELRSLGVPVTGPRTR